MIVAASGAGLAGMPVGAQAYYKIIFIMVFHVVYYRERLKWKRIVAPRHHVRCP
jgi:hypothetical protein